MLGLNLANGWAGGREARVCVIESWAAFSFAAQAKFVWRSVYCPPEFR